MQGRNPDQEDVLEQNEQTNDFNIKNMKKHERKLIRGFMRGFGKIIVLWLISKHRQHGYEIMTQLHEASPLSSKMPSTSMIYPVLHGLERNGLIKGSWEHHGKRKVKYYEITKEGEESLERIRWLVSKSQCRGETSLYREFIEDMFSLKQSINKNEVKL